MGARSRPGPLERAAELAALGVRGHLGPGDAVTLEAALTDPDARVRGAALGALVRAGERGPAAEAWQRAVRDGAPAVRRRAADLGPAVATGGAHVHALASLLDDDDVTVVEAAAWALGELGAAAVEAGAVARIAAVAGGHTDPLAREAAVAALGALGDPAGLPAVLAACSDRPAVRRRAVLALAPFEGPAVEAAIARALEDRDWQVRQAAEDLSP